MAVVLNFGCKIKNVESHTENRNTIIKKDDDAYLKRLDKRINEIKLGNIKGKE